MALGDWQDGEAGATPLSAARLNERDAAIQAAQSTADGALTQGDLDGQTTSTSEANKLLKSDGSGNVIANNIAGDPGSASMLVAGTDNARRTWGAADLAAEIDRRIAAASGA